MHQVSLDDIRQAQVQAPTQVPVLVGAFCININTGPLRLMG